MTSAPSTSGQNQIEEDEEDYMSESLLSQCEDIRPGIMTTMSQARRFKIEEEQREANAKIRNQKTKKQMEKEKRDEALNKPIGEESKGFAMLAKMGYKPGMALGKDREGAITVPIPLEVKPDRTGFGHETDKKRKAEDLLEAHRLAMVKSQKTQHILLGDYRSRKRELAVQKKVEQDLSKCQTVCRELDIRQGIEEPIFPWFWNNHKDKEEEDEEKEEEEKEMEIEIEPNIKLFRLNNYLRESHYYCVWCGIHYENNNDINDNCPGESKAQHEDGDV